MSRSVAVVDLGSTSTRLLITDGADASRRRQVVTRLGEGIGERGQLSADALDRVRQALEGYRSEIDGARVDEVVVVATAAARRAANRDELLAVVDDVLGVRGRVLSAREEAALAFAGATAELGHDGPVLVVDIGGGSTEFTVGSGRTMGDTWSAEVGAGTLTEEFLAGDPPTPWELAAALSVVELHIDDVIREVDGLGEALRDGAAVGVGGTIATVAAVELGLAQHRVDAVHGTELTKDAVEDVFRTLATESAADRAHNPGLPADRVEVIVGGCCVLVEVMRRLGLGSIRVSERDLLDGVAARWREGW